MVRSVKSALEEKERNQFFKGGSEIRKNYLLGRGISQA